MTSEERRPARRVMPHDKIAVQRSIAGSRILKTLPAGTKIFQRILQPAGDTPHRLESIESNRGKRKSKVKLIRSATPLREGGIGVVLKLYGA
jgi:hypothetical protein